MRLLAVPVPGVDRGAAYQDRPAESINGSRFDRLQDVERVLHSETPRVFVLIHAAVDPSEEERDIQFKPGEQVNG